MNLINDAWIPAIRADGCRCKIAPWQIAERDNPIVELAAPRADFQGALYQFLIGLLQTAFAPANHDEWREYWEIPPNVEKVKDAFDSISYAFHIDITQGPAFMQEIDDFSSSDECECPIEDLVGGELSDNTRKKNSDLFVKRGVISQVSPYWAALALYNVQTSGVLAWGKHRVGLRSNGPLTTLILFTGNQPSLWKSIWLNVIDKENGHLIPGDWEKRETKDTFPWMGKTRVSPKKEKTTPIDVNPLQHYWPTPRRIRLNIELADDVCSISGETINYSVKTFKRIHNGVYYTDNWRHPLSPYKYPTENQPFPTVILGKDISETFKDWPLVVTGYGTSTSRSLPALNIRIFNAYRSLDVAEHSVTVWCYGYKANNANVYGYVDGQLPLLHIDLEKIDTFLSWVALLVDSADKSNAILCEAVSYAWFGIDKNKKKRNKHAINKTKKSSSIGNDFFNGLRMEFYSLLIQMAALVKHQNQLSPELAGRWVHMLWLTQQEVFDQWSLSGEQDEKKYRQIILAKRNMEKIFNGNKLIKDLKQIATSDTEAA